jgi:hypothetical protein
LEQQIFDYLPGIDPARIDDIKQTLAPLCIDLGSDNYRGPGLEIAIFGRDILSGQSVARPTPASPPFRTIRSSIRAKRYEGRSDGCSAKSGRRPEIGGAALPFSFRPVRRQPVSLRR